MAGDLTIIPPYKQDRAAGVARSRVKHGTATVLALIVALTRAGSANAQALTPPEGLPQRTITPILSIPSEPPSLGPQRPAVLSTPRALGWLEVRLTVLRGCLITTTAPTAYATRCTGTLPYVATLLSDADPSFVETVSIPEDGALLAIGEPSAPGSSTPAVGTVATTATRLDLDY